MGASVGCLTTTLGSFLILFSRLHNITISKDTFILKIRERKDTEFGDIVLHEFRDRRDLTCAGTRRCTP